MYNVSQDGDKRWHTGNHKREKSSEEFTESPLDKCHWESDRPLDNTADNWKYVGRCLSQERFGRSSAKIRWIYMRIICMYVFIHIWHITYTCVIQVVTYTYAARRIVREHYGQFSKCHVCFCSLDSGDLKFETVRTNQQHICF